MFPIKSAHDLLQQTSPENVAAGHSRSNYCYLFNTLANDSRAGLFPGTDEAATISRLKEFEELTRPPFNPPAAVFMELPAAYTYFGQFMNHDISAPVNVGKTPPLGIVGAADPTLRSKEQRADAATILDNFANEHPEPLTLCSLYGKSLAGPDDEDEAVKALYTADGRRFVVAVTSEATRDSFVEIKRDPDSVIYARLAPDIPRKEESPGKGNVPLIADQRNDGNLILSQLHLAFMLVHNKAVTALEGRHAKPADCFRAARQLVTLHYHWLILNDFLPSVLSKSVQSKPLSQRFPRPEIGPNEVPMEFTTAAFRFGHSMVGRNYDFNANFGSGGKVSDEGASLSQLFNFTSHGNMEDLPRSTIQLPNHWVIDWDRMTKGPEAGNGDPQSRAERIDLDFAPDMLNIAGEARVPEHGSIMFRNLLRGFHRRMPFGQVLADAYHVPRLSPDQILLAMRPEPTPEGAADPIGNAIKRLGFLEETPAWLYFLCEARILEKGERVGPTASHIIADTIVSLMRHNPASLLRYKGGNWEPAQSALKANNGKPLESLRAFLLYASEPV
jgi:Animal haem peroxidase